MVGEGLDEIGNRLAANQLTRNHSRPPRSKGVGICETTIDNAPFITEDARRDTYLAQLCRSVHAMEIAAQDIVTRCQIVGALEGKVLEFDIVGIWFTTVLLHHGVV